MTSIVTQTLNFTKVIEKTSPVTIEKVNTATETVIRPTTIENTVTEKIEKPVTYTVVETKVVPTTAVEVVTTVVPTGQLLA